MGITNKHLESYPIAAHRGGLCLQWSSYWGLGTPLYRSLHVNYDRVDVSRIAPAPRNDKGARESRDMHR